MKKIYKIKKDCAVCGSKKLKNLIKLKNFPLTGIYIKKKLKENFPYYFDQNLNICKNCGHLQLSKFLSPDLLYNNIYANRTSESYLSDGAIKFFKKFLFKNLKSKNRNGFLEIGCNDVKLIENLKKDFNYLYGIDPIWKNKEAPNFKNIKVFGEFVEKINLNKIKQEINVVVSTHNLEHLEDPFKILSKFTKKFNKNTVFFIEVPDADLMIKNHRFDQIFHQHYHYFSLNSLKNLVKRLDCKIISADINYNFWGGSLMVAFKKDINKKQLIKSNYKKIDSAINNKYKTFKKHYENLSRKIQKETDIIGYGAGQMVPSFAYHLKSDLSFLKYIVDDNKNRANQKYPDLKPHIKFFKKNLVSSKVLITALDGVNSISKKLKNLKVPYYSPLLN